MYHNNFKFATSILVCVCVCEGSLKETRYEWPSDQAGRMVSSGCGELALDQVAYINGKHSRAHYVESLSHTQYILMAWGIAIRVLCKF